MSSLAGIFSGRRSGWRWIWVSGWLWVTGGSGGVWAGESGYAAWRSGEFSVEEVADAGISGPDEDPDGDGLENWREWLRATRPKAAGGEDHGKLWRDGNWLGITFTRQATLAPGYAVGGEASADMADWSLPVVE